MFKLEVRKSDTTREVLSLPGDDLLSCLLSAGIDVSYSCRRGDCGQCSATLVSGSVESMNASAPSRNGDEVFLCNVTACSDVVVRIPYFPELDSIQSLRTPAKIHELSALGDWVVEVVLRLPPTQVFRYLPGQFVRITNKKRVTRSYSLSDVSAADSLIRMHVRRVSNGAFSDYLFCEAKEGDLLHLEGPHGHFFVQHKDQARKTIFLSTGTGIAPIFAILKGLGSERMEALGSISVYWGNRVQSDEYLGQQLRALSSRCAFEYVSVFSQESHDGPRYVQDVVAARHSDLSESLVFACGNPAMIESVRVLCQSLGLPEDRFRSDPFTSS
jgi:CDP-4-dehydro-6-deoxyglucose reductase, E3